MYRISAKWVTGVTAIAVMLAASPVLAKPDTNRVPATNTKSNRSVVIPAHAVQIADNVFSLGTALDPQSGKIVEGIMVLDNRGNKAKGGQKGKPDKPGGNGDSTSNCYSFIANGAGWKNTEDYRVDPTNIDGMSDSFVRSTIAAAVEVWDSEVTTDVFGVEVAGVVDGVDLQSPDGVNEVLFGNIDSNGTVAVTVVWGIFRGKPSQRQIVEWDQMYDDVDYNFGDADVNASLMDLLNIGVHEIGHAGGLGHPSDSCTEESMFRFVSEGETGMRDLFDGDIAGINALY